MSPVNKTPKSQQVKNYPHPDAESPMRPDVGTQAQFKKKKPPVTYRYDSSLSPALDWDGQNPAREEAEILLQTLLAAQDKAAKIAQNWNEENADNAEAEVLRQALAEAQEAAAKLKAMSKPFLNWAGKAERLSFDVPTLPLFVHERLSTEAIIETLKGHRPQLDMLDLFADPRHSVTEQVLKAYEYRDQWVNRMMLGDSLVVMNSLLHFEGMGGQVQMIYMDPPYGVKFGSNFQPFVRRRDVSHNDDESMTREPEMVQAYRDTWELGLHSYLTYLRDRLLLARDLLAPTGSIFVQISDDNLHHVREVMDEVFGAENLCAIIPFRKTGGLRSKLLDSIVDYLIWFAKDIKEIKYNQLYKEKVPGDTGASQYKYVIKNGELAEYKGDLLTANPAELCTHDNLTSQGNTITDYTFNGKVFRGGWENNQSRRNGCSCKGRTFSGSW